MYMLYNYPESLNCLIIIMCMPVYISNSIFFMKMMLIDRRNLLWNTQFLKFLLNFPDF